MATPLDLQLIDALTGGVNMPLASQDGYLAVARASGGTVNLDYIPPATALAADAAVAAALAPLLRGTGLTVVGGKLQPRFRPRLLRLEDRFLSGSASSGAIGQLGWNLLGSGTPALNRVSVASEGTVEKIDLVTSAATNDRSVLALGETETRKVATATGLVLAQTSWSYGLTDRKVFFGMSSNFASAATAASDALGIYYDSSLGPNLQLIARSGGSGSPVDTGVAAPNDTSALISMWQPVAGTVQFYAGNTLLGSISSGIPTAAMNMGWRIETLATATKTLKIGYFNWEAAPAASFDDDTFLET